MKMKLDLIWAVAVTFNYQQQFSVEVDVESFTPRWTVATALDPDSMFYERWSSSGRIL